MVTAMRNYIYTAASIGFSLLMAGLMTGCGALRKPQTVVVTTPTGSYTTRAPAIKKAATKKVASSSTLPKKGNTQAPVKTSTTAKKATGNATATPAAKSIAITGLQVKGAKREKIEKVVQAASTYLGTPYRLGGTTRNGIDCSALMQASFKAGGVSLPRTADAQATEGQKINRKEVRPGDVLFFDTMKRGRVGHAGLVVGVQGSEIDFIHASVKGGVRVDKLSNPYWSKYYLGARRVLD